jgi:hypothetical protein
MPTVLKRIRQRFGISAPRMTVRTHLAWYWRWLGMVLFAAVALALAAWMYDAGRRFAGFDRSEIEDEVSRLRQSVERLEAEAAKLRAVSHASDARMKIEQSTQSQLAKQVKSLVEDNRRLQEDLAFFENLAPGAERLTINRFTVQPDILPGEYRYRLLVLMGSGQGDKRERQFRGSLQLVLNVQVQSRNGMIVLPDSAAPEDAAFRLNFKYFQRVEGTFRVPLDTKVRSVQARVLESGTSQARATQSVDLS